MQKNVISAITHGGIFHCDDVFAAAILEKRFGHIKFSRVFKLPEILPAETIVFDIGGGEFDHHQKGGNGCRENGVPYAAAGLIWKQFGMEVCQMEVGQETYNPNLVWELVDELLFQSIDAFDNGFEIPKTNYQIFTISQAISGFNPTWDITETSDFCFRKAIDFCTIVLNNVLRTSISIVKAREIVEKQIAKNKQILILDKFVPWQEALFASKHENAKNILLVIFPSNRGGYNWQCVPTSLNGFCQKKPAPIEWHGISGTELQKVSGVPDAVFCHPKGFIGSASSLDGALTLAKKIIES